MPRIEDLNDSNIRVVFGDDGQIQSLIDDKGAPVNIPIVTNDPVTGGIDFLSGARKLRWRGLPKYTGFVSNKSRSCYNFANNQYYWQGMHTLTAMDNIDPSSQIIYGAWYTTNTGESALGAPLIINSLVVEYPIGTLTRITFGGANSVSIPSGNNAASDAIGVSIPRGARYRIRVNAQSTAGMIYVGGANIPYCDETNGDTFEFSATALTDKTMGVMTTSAGAVNQGFCMPPLAVVGPTSRPSFAILGDSKATGIKDRFGDAQLQRGLVERGIGSNFGLTVLSQSSETAGSFISAGSRRAALANTYASHVICEYGFNDLSLGAATVLSRLASIWALFTAKKVYQTTLTPSTTSTDSWATLANQTVFSYESARVSVNAAIRWSPAPLAGIFDVSDIVESSRNSGKWNIALTQDASLAITPNPQTWDGLHENSIMCAAIAAHPMWSPARFSLGGLEEI